MKVYAISDMPGKLDGLDPVGADLVIIPGDYICNDVTEVRGLRIAGCSWIPRISGRWAFETADGAITFCCPDADVINVFEIKKEAE